MLLCYSWHHFDAFLKRFKFRQLYLEVLNWKNGSVSGERHAGLAGVAGKHPARMLYGSKMQASG